MPSKTANTASNTLMTETTKKSAEKRNLNQNSINTNYQDLSKNAFIEDNNHFEKSAKNAKASASKFLGDNPNFEKARKKGAYKPETAESLGEVDLKMLDQFLTKRLNANISQLAEELSSRHENSPESPSSAQIKGVEKVISTQSSKKEPVNNFEVPNTDFTFGEIPFESTKNSSHGLGTQNNNITLDFTNNSFALDSATKRTPSNTLTIETTETDTKRQSLNQDTNNPNDQGLSKNAFIEDNNRFEKIASIQSRQDRSINASLDKHQNSFQNILNQTAINRGGSFGKVSIQMRSSTRGIWLNAKDNISHSAQSNLEEVNRNLVCSEDKAYVDAMIETYKLHIEGLKNTLESYKQIVKYRSDSQENLQRQLIEQKDNLHKKDNELIQHNGEIKELKRLQDNDKSTISKLENDIAEKTDLINQLQKKLNNGFTQLQVGKDSEFEVINNKISKNISKQNKNLNPKGEKELKIDNFSEQIGGTSKLIFGTGNSSLLSHSKQDSNLDKSLKIEQYSVEILSSPTARDAITQATDGTCKSTHQKNGSKKFIDWCNILELVNAIGATTTVRNNLTALNECITKQQIDFTKDNSKFTLSQNQTTNAITLESRQSSFGQFIETLSKLIDEQQKVTPDKTVHITFKKIPNLSVNEYAEALQKLPHHKNIAIDYQGDNNSAFTNALAQNQSTSNNVLNVFHNEHKSNEGKHDRSSLQV
ncbi:hypothetical protein [Cysteiniphilum halobium]|uniref:hypothetical protein n=1 Tax=Cysteiniphilum halobium TaxID=2219059 RepID=UPI003F825AAE